ncbi:MAG: hypothetical protein WAN36_12735, partial [Calditrichia bacterium]
SIQYQTGEGASTANVKKTFLPSGKLVKVEMHSPGQKVVNYPIYTEADDQWVCIGWDSQIEQANGKRSGIAYRLELGRIEGYWLPIRADMLVKTAEDPESSYTIRLYLKDYQFNMPLQEISPAPDSAKTSSRVQ